MTACENIKKTALWEVDVMDIFHAKFGANHMRCGLFSGRTLVYSNLNSVLVRILPRYVSEEGSNLFWSLLILTCDILYPNIHINK